MTWRDGTSGSKGAYMCSSSRSSGTLTGQFQRRDIQYPWSLIVMIHMIISYAYIYIKYILMLCHLYDMVQLVQKTFLGKHDLLALINAVPCATFKMGQEGRTIGGASFLPSFLTSSTTMSAVQLLLLLLSCRC